MIWFLQFLSLLSVVCRCYHQILSTKIKSVLVYTVSTLFLFCSPYNHCFILYAEWGLQGGKEVHLHMEYTKLIKQLPLEKFFGCTGLTSVELPKGLTRIGDKAFYKCWNLKEIEIPNGVTYIGNEAFSECLKLTEINLPNSLQSMGTGVFYGCKGLVSVEIPQTDECQLDGFLLIALIWKL